MADRLWKHAQAQVRPVLRTVAVVSVGSGAFDGASRPREDGWAILKGVAGARAALLDEGLSVSFGSRCRSEDLTLVEGQSPGTFSGFRNHNSVWVTCSNRL